MVGATPLSTEALVERVLVMRTQEDTCYNYQTYLPKMSDDNESRLNITWREKICHWSFNVVDHFDLSREVVGISLDLFDRFFATRNNKCNGNLALLTSLTTLHLAIKMHETKKIKITTLANLSRGQFDPSHIEQMEWLVLSTLGWKVNPPTAYSFISHLLLFLPQEAHPAVRKELFEMSRYLSELTVCDSFFVEHKNSTIAFASILNVMDELSFSRLSAGIREKFLRNLSEKIGLSNRSPEVCAARERIRAMFAMTTSNDCNNNNHGLLHASKSTEDSLSVSSAGSGSSWASRFGSGSRVRTGSGDSKGSWRRCVPISSPVTTSRAARAVSSSAF